MSRQKTTTDNSDNDILKNILLEAFISVNVTYEFVHDIDIDLNVLRKIVKKYQNEEDLLHTSKDIYQHLKAIATHPKIKDGDLVFAKFEDVQIKNTYCEALGIYKIEQTEYFLEVDINDENVSSLKILSGILSKNIDKACLIVFTKGEPCVFVIDKNNKDTQYWIDDFLHVRQRKDEYANTENVMAMAKQFQFFKEKDSFDMEEFANEVIEQPEVIESFKNYKKSYEEEHATEIDDSFTISQHAFKKQQRSYKRIIRLDKKIQIIIDGNRDHIEQGEDERGKYYKVYYSTEE